MSVVQPKNVSAMVVDTGGYGDRAGEYLRMSRGRYSAWAYVVIGFIYVGLLMGVTVGLGVGALGGFLASLVGAGHSAVGSTVVICDAVAALAVTILIFRDRWKVNEAFSSRACSGIVNLSLLYVPVIAAGYALVRGVGKLRRR
jgi:hypothetical protein